jgi:hypothetical protein
VLTAGRTHFARTNVRSSTLKMCARCILKGALRTVVVQTDTQKPVNGLEKNWSIKEKKSVTSLMILLHSRINRLMQTKHVGDTFKFVSCKTEWTESNCVAEHILEDTKLHFCLNCDNWVRHKKNRVLDQRWSLFDQDGNLYNFV